MIPPGATRVRSHSRGSFPLASLCRIESIYVVVHRIKRRAAKQNNRLQTVQGAAIDPHGIIGGRGADAAVACPRALPPSRWVYEEKVDGYRMVAYRDRDRLRLISRNDIDHTALPGTGRRARRLAEGSFVLDGELAVFDAQLQSRFDWLRHRPTRGP